MGLSTAIASYFLVWWLTLFAVLPWGIRAQGDEASPGTDPGAPAATKLGTKLLWTTGVAAVVWSIGALIYVEGWVTVDGLAALFGLHAPVAGY